MHQGMFASEQPQFSPSTIVDLAQLLKRDVPTEPERRRLVEEQ